MPSDAFSATGSLILNPLIDLWNGFVTIFPGVIAAVILIIIGYFIAMGLGHIIKSLLLKTGLDSALQKSKFSKAVGHFHLSNIVGEIIKWYVFIIFIGEAVNQLNLGTISDLLQQFITWLPNVIVACAVIIFGVALAHYVSMKIEEHTTTKGVKFFSKLLKIVIYFVVLVIGLQQIGIDVSILENTWYLLIGALAVGLAIALGIGLGGALKSEGREIVDDIKGLMKH